MAALNELFSDQLTSKALTIEQRSDLIVDTMFTMMEYGKTSHMANLLKKVPGVGFTNGKPGKYNGCDAPITEASIKQIRIYTGDTRDGDGYRYFKQVNLIDSDLKKHDPIENEDPLAAARRRAHDTGLRAAAWQETNAEGKVKTYDGNKSDIIFSFPGFEGKEVEAVTAIKAHLELNPQVYGVPDFIKETMDKVWPGGEGMGKASVTSSSMGTASGLVAQRYLISAEVPAPPLNAMEPYAMNMALDHINRELQWSGSTLSQIINAALPEGKGTLLNTGAETIANPNMSSVFDHSYRSVKLQEEDGKIAITDFSKIASMPLLAPRFNLNNNKMTGTTFYTDMTNAPDILPESRQLIKALDPMKADPLHMNPNIANWLIEENKTAVEAWKKDKPIPDGHGLPDAVRKPAARGKH